MRKLSRLEGLFLVLALVFALASLSWFFWQNQGQPPQMVTLSQPDVQEAEPVAPENPAPGMLPGEKLNINMASAADLTRLPGIGAGRAEAIVTHRETVGDFASIEEIMQVSGIGEGIYSKLSDYIAVADS